MKGSTIKANYGRLLFTSCLPLVTRVQPSPSPTAMVTITEDPQPTGPVLVGETAVFTCQARSIPAPNITWFRLENGTNVRLMDNDDDINIMSQSQPEDSFTTRSTLSVMVTGDEDFTEYFCVGDNGFDNSTSDNATLGCE